jgi:ubiquinone/menaquinone biosynthesis C-methylase UbiE
LSTSDIHSSAAKGFEASPEAYERGRAGYPKEAIDCLVKELSITRSSTVLDLGAGTGKLTRALLSVGCPVIAVEPVAAMRLNFSRNTPDIEIRDGRAEDIPLEHESVDAVVCAQAFHWFDGVKAISEIHRVLKPGGTLGLIWNVRDESADWMAQLTQIMDPYAGDTPRYRTGIWRAAFEDSVLFTEFRHTQCAHTHTMSEDATVDRIASISFIAALPLPTRHKVLDQSRAVIQEQIEQTGGVGIKFPYRTDIFWTTRKDQ